jgi:hypothetical protein
MMSDITDHDWSRLKARVIAGWCQGKTHDDEWNACLWGAISDCFENKFPDIVNVLKAVLHPKYNNNLITFNDDFNTTKQDVLDLIDIAKEYCNDRKDQA